MQIGPMKANLQFTIPQSLNGEDSFVGAPASLYNLTKSAPDPYLLYYFTKVSIAFF